MDDLVLKIWPYLERLGAAGSVVLTVGLYFLNKDRLRHQDNAEKLQAQNTELLKDQITAAEQRTDKMVRTVEQNTAAMAASATAQAATADLVRTALLQRGAGQ